MQPDLYQDLLTFKYMCLFNELPGLDAGHTAGLADLLYSAPDTSKFSATVNIVKGLN